MSLDPQILIIGGGASGLAAARVAATYGARVALLDELASTQIEQLSENLDVHRARVWGVFPAWEAAAAIGLEPIRISAPIVILATGSFETTVPFSGSTLPGVMTATGFSRLVSLGLVPGQRVALVEDGPEDQNLIEMIAKVECDLVARTGPAKATVNGNGQVESITINGQSLRTDIVIVSGRRLPDVALAAMAGCRLELEIDETSWRVVADAAGRTSIENVWACGDVRGCGVDPGTAAFEGRLSGMGACATLGLVDQSMVDALLSTSSESSVMRQPAAPDTAYQQPWIQSLPVPKEGNTA